MKLNEKAMLVKLSIGLPGNSRNDRKTTAEVCHEKTTKGKWLKTMFPPAHYDPPSKLAGEVSTWVYTNTLPWQDDGFRILTSASYFKFTEKMREFKGSFHALKEAFVNAEAEIVVWARQEHNGTFNADDYSDFDKIGRKFQFTTTFLPLPESSDFRVALNDEEVASIRQGIHDSVSCAIEDARRDLWQRLAVPLAAMSAKLSEPNGIFRDSLVTNLKDVCDLIPSLNLTDDPNLETFRQQVAASVAECTPDALRANKTTRAEAAKQAADILSKMQGYL